MKRQLELDLVTYEKIWDDFDWIKAFWLLLNYRYLMHLSIDALDYEDSLEFFNYISLHATRSN